MAGRLGGFVAEPANRDYAARFNQTLHREVLDAELGLDAYIAAYVALREQLEVALLEAARAATTEPVMAQALDLMLRDKRRHAQFGWLYLEQRRAELDRPALASRAAQMVERFYASGLMVPGLNPAIAGDVAAAIETAAAAGLGVAALQEQKRVLQRALQESQQRFAALSIDCSAISCFP
jgi:hypothetical protein